MKYFVFLYPSQKSVLFSWHSVFEMFIYILNTCFVSDVELLIFFSCSVDWCFLWIMVSFAVVMLFYLGHSIYEYLILVLITFFCSKRVPFKVSTQEIRHYICGQKNSRHCQGTHKCFWPGRGQANCRHVPFLLLLQIQSLCLFPTSLTKLL